MPNYADRDKQGTICNYVLLWKRPDLDLQTFDAYWGNVHGPVCARLPALHQFWQIRTWHNLGTIWTPIEGVRTTSTAEENFDAIAELTFTSPDILPTYYKPGLEYLGGDEVNFTTKLIPNMNTPITYYDEIENPTPSWEVEYDKFHIMIGKSDGVSREQLHDWLQNTFAPQLANSDCVIKLRLHLFFEPEQQGANIPEQNIHSALEIGFKNRSILRTYLASDEYKKATEGMAKYVKSFQPYPERARSTVVYNGEATLVGQWGLAGAQAIEQVGAINQLREQTRKLMLGKD